jgi:hypothetical protein
MNIRNAGTTKGKKMTATCHTCNWESLNYKHKGWAEKSADNHQDLYHRGQSNIIAIKEAK